MVNKLRVLVVEDSEDDTTLLLRELQRGGYQVEHTRVETAADMKAALANQEWDLILSDFSMPHFSATGALAVLKESGLDLPFLIVSGTIGEETAVAALQAGAHDFMLKHKTARLIPAIERNLREAQERQKRREAEQALHESEQRFRLIAENTHDLISLTDAAGRYVYVNPSHEAILGYPVEQFVGQRQGNLVHPEDQLLLTNRQHDVPFEFRMRKANGEWIWVEAASYPLILKGEPLVVAIGRDVTERKQAEAQLRRFNQRLGMLHTIDRAILTDQSTEAICRVALEFIVAQLSVGEVSVTIFDLETQKGTVYASYSQYSPIAPPGTRFSLSAFPAEEIEALRKGEIRRIGDISTLLPAPSETADGDTSGLPSYIAIPLVAQGELIGSINLGTDQPDAFSADQLDMPREIADQLAVAIQQARYRAQIQHHAAELEERVILRTAELQNTKDRLEAILNNSSDAIVLTTSSGTIQQVNRTFGALFDYPTDAVFGRSLLILAGPEDQRALRDAIARCLETGASQSD